MNLHELDTLIRAVCPIDGIDSSGGISFSASATAQQKSAAQAAMATNLPLLSDGPTATEIATAEARAAAKADNVISYFATHTTVECEAYVQTNVTDLASAKSLLKKFAIAICALAHQELA